ncbi:kinesin-domain-containing protein [Didymella exigua CBS 183.55]|uniref:Kinesin-like protein n=1 Tax=Didymella exigua CBS 183.55 TaxID=1150837 RepID=A0A6A5RR95_9PLEO|nr:kinesin-domain-containing protein [Didymella exigua CBS 183.55]KAF1929564.1 kinesin-domain-containing protein [Didymella exigua CBS 183.55]
MSGNQLPRRSIAPPTGPLPSLPVPKQRSSNVGPASLRTPSSGLPSPTNRAVSYSNSPYRPGAAKHTTSPSVPTIAAEHAGGQPQGKSLRKVVSIGAFPQPPKHGLRTPSSPLASSASVDGDTVDQRLSTGSKGSIPSRRSSLKKPPRASTAGGGRGLLPKSPLSPPSFLNGNGSAESVAVDTSHLSLPSPPQSRSTSPNGSRSTSATTVEEGDDEARGRKSNKPDGESGGKGNVIVSVRVRPDAGPNDGQQEKDWEVNGKRHVVTYRGRDGGGDYIYDNVFDTQDNNARVYDATAKRLVRRVMEGYHGTVFAYGMTGTGKTFSMQGTATNPGVIPLAITDIFSYIRETPHREFLLRVSYLEIYNEKINDLLAGSVMGMGGQPGPQEEIKLREDSKRGVYATPLKEEIVQSPTQLLRVISRGDQARRVAGTQYNSRSSRSHAVVQIVVESRERASGPSLAGDKRSAIIPGGVRVSTLSLIDLAGSEKAADDKERRTEGSHINKSLLTLGAVVGGLAGNKTGKDGKKDNHLPYRDSKLTRLLQGALSGNSLVSILCTIQIGANGSPAASATHVNETLNTLKFASRAKNNIISHAKKADDSLGAGGDAGSRALLDRYRLEIQDLKRQLEEGKKKEARDEEEEEMRRDKEEERVREQQDKQRHEEQMLEMQLARTALKERIEHLNRLILSSKSLGVNNGRTYSSLSLQRASTFSHVSDFRPMSVRSSASHATLEVPRASIQSFPLPVEGSEEDDSIGENGDGMATPNAQIQALQADLADRNRYIRTLEQRLHQARRSSHSRVSLSINSRHGSEDGGLLAKVAERDAEISTLRAQLEDKERMIAALNRAKQRNDTAHDVGSDGSPGSRRTSSYQRSEGSSVVNILHAKGPTSPTSPNSTPFFPPAPTNPGKNIEEMTRMLDEMITGRVDRAARRSLMPVNEARRT